MWLDNNQLIIFNNKLNPRSNWVSDELTFSASDNDDNPDEPIIQTDERNKQQTSVLKV